MIEPNVDSIGSNVWLWIKIYVYFLHLNLLILFIEKFHSNTTILSPCHYICRKFCLRCITGFEWKHNTKNNLTSTNIKLLLNSAKQIRKLSNFSLWKKYLFVRKWSNAIIWRGLLLSCLPKTGFTPFLRSKMTVHLFIWRMTCNWWTMSE